MELIVEQISRSKKVLHRQKFAGDKIKVGRGFDNDVILADPYVCAHHLEVKRNELGQWMIDDLQSVNGSFDEIDGRLEQAKLLRFGDVISIGQSRIRFIDPHQPVRPTIPLSGIEGTLNWLSRPFSVVLVLTIYFALLAINYYFQSYVEIKPSQMIGRLLSHFMFVSVIPLLFVVLARMFKHDARLWTQMAVCYSFGIMYLLLQYFDALMRFNVSSQWLVYTVQMAFEAALVFGLIWVCSYVALHQSQLRRNLISFSVTAAILVLALVQEQAARPDFSVSPKYNGSLLIPDFAFAEPVSIEQFVTDSEGIFTKAAEQAKEQD